MPKDSDVHVWNDTLDGWRPPATFRRSRARCRRASARARTRRPRRRPRLRPVPPPPSQAPASRAPDQRRVRGRRSGAATRRTARTRAAAHGHAPIVASHSSVGLGLASVAPVVVPAPTMPPAGILDTPVPIRELVQAHKAHNGSRRTAPGWQSPRRPRPARSPTASRTRSTRSTWAEAGGSRARRSGRPMRGSRRRRSRPPPVRAPGSRTAKLATGAVAAGRHLRRAVLRRVQEAVAAAGRRQPQGRAAAGGRGQGARGRPRSRRRRSRRCGPSIPRVGAATRDEPQDRDGRARRREEAGAARAGAQPVGARRWHDADRDVAGHVHGRAARRRHAASATRRAERCRSATRWRRPRR